MVLEIDAMVNSVSAVTGCGSSRLVTPKPRSVCWPFSSSPKPTPGTRYSAIFAVISAAISSMRSSGPA